MIFNIIIMGFVA